MALRRRLAAVPVVAILAVAGGLTLGTSAARAVPSVSYTCTPAPQDCNGWFRTDAAIDWTVLPSDAGKTGCLDKTFTADTPGTNEFCSADDGSATVTVQLKIRLDKTPPLVTGAQPERGADVNGWYRRPVRVDFEGSDATSGLRSCSSVTYAQADSAQATVQGTCQDIAGNVSAPFPFRLRYDATAPDITGATPEREPDHAGWYTRPVAWRFDATDAVSGLATCPTVVHDGPQTAAATVTAACGDRAGNVATRAFRFRYDALPPAQPSVAARPRDDAVRVRIRVAQDVKRIVVRRKPKRRKGGRSAIYRGRPRSLTDRRVRNGKRYRYRVVAIDQAGNRSSARAAAVPGPRLLAPAHRAELSAPPRLDWTGVRGASYYNVQLFRGKHKVLTAWPRRSRLQLERRWRFAGRMHRLGPGRYRWQVWPGFGARRAADFGARIGRRTFVIAEPPPTPR